MSRSHCIDDRHGCGSRFLHGPLLFGSGLKSPLAFQSLFFPLGLSPVAQPTVRKHKPHHPRHQSMDGNLIGLRNTPPFRIEFFRRYAGFGTLSIGPKSNRQHLRSSLQMRKRGVGRLNQSKERPGRRFWEEEALFRYPGLREQPALDFSQVADIFLCPIGGRIIR